MSSFAQNNKTEKKNIRTLIINFSDAVETRNELALRPLLSENFRVVINKFPTNDKITILTNESYLALLKAGKLGGERRKIRIKSIDINHHIAFSKIEFESEKTIFITYQTYLLNENNVWQLSSDMPYIKKKNLNTNK